MKAKAFIEIGNDGTYSVYIESNTLSYGIHGTGKTVKEAVEDFNSAYESMKEFYKEQNKNFTECEFDFFYDIASLLEYYRNISRRTNTPEEDELRNLPLFIKNYEDRNYPMPELDVLRNIKVGLEEMKSFKNGELKTTLAKDFLNEL